MGQQILAEKMSDWIRFSENSGWCEKTVTEYVAHLEAKCEGNLNITSQLLFHIFFLLKLFGWGMGVWGRCW